MTTPTVTENPLRLAPTERDRFVADRPFVAAWPPPRRRPQDA